MMRLSYLTSTTKRPIIEYPIIDNLILNLILDKIDLASCRYRRADRVNRAHIKAETTSHILYNSNGESRMIISEGKLTPLDGHIAYQ